MSCKQLSRWEIEAPAAPGWRDLAGRRMACPSANRKPLPRTNPGTRVQIGRGPVDRQGRELGCGVGEVAPARPSSPCRPGVQEHERATIERRSAGPARQRPGRRRASNDHEPASFCMMERDAGSGDGLLTFRSVVSVLVRLAVRTSSSTSRPGLRAACGRPRPGLTSPAFMADHPPDAARPVAVPQAREGRLRPPGRRRPLLRRLGLAAMPCG